MVRALRSTGRITDTMATPETRRQLLAAVAACEDKKGEDTRILELDPADSGLADFFLITSASNDRQVVAIADEIEMRLKKDFGLYAASVEGRRQAEWILLDYVDIVIHVFLAEKRAFYDIERLRKSARPLTGAELESELKADLAKKTLAVRSHAPKTASKALAKAGKPATARKSPAAPKATSHSKSPKGDSKVSAKPAKKKPAKAAAKKAAPKKSAAKKAAPKKAAAKPAAKAAAKKAVKKAAPKASAKPSGKPGKQVKTAAKTATKTAAKAPAKVAAKVSAKPAPAKKKLPGKKKPPTLTAPAAPAEAVPAPPVQPTPAPEPSTGEPTSES
jgi:ribosome-associated protein